MRHLQINLLLYGSLMYLIQGVDLKSRPHNQFYFNNKHKSAYLSEILNTYRKNNNFDYNYEDWEDDNFDITETTESNNATIATTTTNEAEVTNTNITNDNVTITTEALNATTTFDTTTETNATITDFVTNVTVTESLVTHTVTTSVTLPTLPETEDLLQLFPTSSTDANETVPSFDLETYFPGITYDILDFTTTIATTTISPFIKEIREKQKKDGIFTSSLIVLFGILSTKNPEETSRLLATLNSDIERLNTENKLLMFGGTIAEVFQSMVQMLASEPADVMLNHFKYAVHALEHRRKVLKEDTNILLDVTDTIFIDADIDNIAVTLEDITNYPNSTESARDVIHTALEAFIYKPFHRIAGTARERLLMTELNTVIKRRLYPGEDIQ